MSRCRVIRAGNGGVLIRTSYRYFTEDMVDPIAVTAGLVQTALYLDFFYVYFTKWVPTLTNVVSTIRSTSFNAQGTSRTEVRIASIIFRYNGHDMTLSCSLTRSELKRRLCLVEHVVIYMREPISAPDRESVTVRNDVER